MIADTQKHKSRASRGFFGPHDGDISEGLRPAFRVSVSNRLADVVEAAVRDWRSRFYLPSSNPFGAA